MKSRERIWKNEGEWTREVEIRKRKTFLAVTKHTWLYYDLLHVIKRTFISSGGFTERTLRFLCLQYPTTKTQLRQKWKVAQTQTVTADLQTT